MKCLQEQRERNSSTPQKKGHDIGTSPCSIGHTSSSGGSCLRCSYEMGKKCTYQVIRAMTEVDPQTNVGR